MTRIALLDKLVQRGAVWRGHRGAALQRQCRASGWHELDRLIGGGWPAGALTELLLQGASGLAVLMPALAGLSREGRWLVWVSPPHLPYAPALQARGVVLERSLLVDATAEQGLWVTEQALRSGSCGAVLSWPSALTAPEVRRLQLAAEAGGGLGLVFRPPAAASQPSPAALRLQVRPECGGLRLRVLKRPGGWAGGETWIRP